MITAYKEPGSNLYTIEVPYTISGPGGTTLIAIKKELVSEPEIDMHIVEAVLKLEGLNERKTAIMNSENPPIPTMSQIVDAAIERAVKKGFEIFVRVRKENVMLGIESFQIEGRPATDVVLERSTVITSALTSGSTKAAIRFCKAFPEEQKDSRFLTNARLLSIVNELEVFHSMPISADL